RNQTGGAAMLDDLSHFLGFDPPVAFGQQCGTGTAEAIDTVTALALALVQVGDVTDAGGVRQGSQWQQRAHQQGGYQPHATALLSARVADALSRAGWLSC